MAQPNKLLNLRVFRMPPPLRTPAKRRFVPNAYLCQTPICPKRRFDPGADGRQRKTTVRARVKSAFLSNWRSCQFGVSRQIGVLVNSAFSSNLRYRRFRQICVFVRSEFSLNLRFCQMSIFVKSAFWSNWRFGQIGV